jgi:hypothetical protein
MHIDISIEDSGWSTQVSYEQHNDKSYTFEGLQLDLVDDADVGA